MKNNAIAILYEVVVLNDKMEYLKPVKTLIGSLCQDNTFYDNKDKRHYYNDTYKAGKYIFGSYHLLDLDQVKKNLNVIQRIRENYFHELSSRTYFRVWDNNNNQSRIVDFSLDRGYEEDDLYDELEVEETAAKETKTTNLESINVEELYNKVKSNVIGQDIPIRKIVTALAKNYFFNSPKQKSNIFILGPSGVGKTEIIRQIASTINVPLAIEDITSYTVSGYIGNSVEKLLEKLLIQADDNLEVAQQGILVIDEIDKKAKENNNSPGISHEGVLNSLLKIIEGKGNITNFVYKGQTISFDTSNLTVIAIGAFNSLTEKSLARTPVLGFNSTVINDCSTKKAITIDKLINYGIPSEFMRRFSTVIQLNSLSIEELYDILKTSKISPWLLFLNSLKQKNIEVEYNENIILDMAKKAYTYKSGASSLNRVVDEITSEIIFQVLSQKPPFTIIIGEDIINNNLDFTIKKEKRKIKIKMFK